MSIDKKIKDILKAENLSWAKLALMLGGGDRSSLKVKVEGWAIKLNDTFNKIGYEVTFQKINENSKDSDKTVVDTPGFPVGQANQQS